MKKISKEGPPLNNSLSVNTFLLRPQGRYLIISSISIYITVRHKRPPPIMKKLTRVGLVVVGVWTGWNREIRCVGDGAGE